MATNIMRRHFGLNEIVESPISLLKASMGEFLGLVFISFIGIGSVIFSFHMTSILSIFMVPLAFGIATWGSGLVFLDISGGHFNPAITLAYMALLKTPTIRGLTYILSQCLGAVCGAYILGAMTSDGFKYILSSNGSFEPVNFIIAGFLISFILFAEHNYINESPNFHDFGPLVSGVTIGLMILCTRAIINPAVSFGLVVATGVWRGHWVACWAGPTAGALLAAFLHQYLPLNSIHLWKKWRD